ncbi:MAG TPA: hypothetical protein PLY45_04155 [bacterium]|nr:hypothetical protein [bacterium]
MRQKSEIFRSAPGFSFSPKSMSRSVLSVCSGRLLHTKSRGTMEIGRLDFLCASISATSAREGPVKKRPSSVSPEEGRSMRTLLPSAIIRGRSPWSSGSRGRPSSPISFS